MQVARDGKLVDTLGTERSYFPSTAPMLGPVSRFFEGESTSEVGLKAGLLRDVWTAIAPTRARCARGSQEGDKVFSAGAS